MEGWLLMLALAEAVNEREEIALLKEIGPPQQQRLQRQVSDRWQRLYHQQRQPLVELVQRLTELETTY